MNVTNLFLRSVRLSARSNIRCVLRGMSEVAGNNRDGEGVKDPAPIFFSDQVQTLLKELTACDMEKVFQPKKAQQKLKSPKYQFMSSDELEMAMGEAKKRADEQLQMPPILLARKEINQVLARDPVLKGYDREQSSYIFADITFGKKDSERLIVKRDSEGVLSQASWDERDRINQVYFPFPGRKWKLPRMFEPEHLEELLKREQFVFILDKACVQFEPNNQDYIDLTQKIYEWISDKKAFDKLRSTRHFGPMAFHLAWSKQIDNLVLECIQKERLEDAVRAITLLHVIHPSSKSANVQFNGDNSLQFIKNYIAQDSKKRGPLELAVQSYEEKIDASTQGYESAQNN